MENSRLFFLLFALEARHGQTKLSVVQRARRGLGLDSQLGNGRRRHGRRRRMASREVPSRRPREPDGQQRRDADARSTGGSWRPG
jgi:hypothetical protein